MLPRAVCRQQDGSRRRCNKGAGGEAGKCGAACRGKYTPLPSPACFLTTRPYAQALETLLPLEQYKVLMGHLSHAATRANEAIFGEVRWDQDDRLLRTDFFKKEERAFRQAADIFLGDGVEVGFKALQRGLVEDGGPLAQSDMAQHLFAMYPAAVESCQDPPSLQGHNAGRNLHNFLQEMHFFASSTLPILHTLFAHSREWRQWLESIHRLHACDEKSPLASKWWPFLSGIDAFHDTYTKSDTWWDEHGWPADMAAVGAGEPEGQQESRKSGSSDAEEADAPAHGSQSVADEQSTAHRADRAPVTMTRDIIRSEAGSDSGDTIPEDNPCPDQVAFPTDPHADTQRDAPPGPSNSTPSSNLDETCAQASQPAPSLGLPASQHGAGHTSPATWSFSGQKASLSQESGSTTRPMSLIGTWSDFVTNIKTPVSDLVSLSTKMGRVKDPQGLYAELFEVRWLHSIRLLPFGK